MRKASCAKIVEGCFRHGNSKSKTTASSEGWRDRNKTNETGSWEVKRRRDRDEVGPYRIRPCRLESCLKFISERVVIQTRAFYIHTQIHTQHRIHPHRPPFSVLYYNIPALWPWESHLTCLLYTRHIVVKKTGTVLISMEPCVSEVWVPDPK